MTMTVMTIIVPLLLLIVLRAAAASVEGNRPILLVCLRRDGICRLGKHPFGYVVFPTAVARFRPALLPSSFRRVVVGRVVGAAVGQSEELYVGRNGGLGFPQRKELGWIACARRHAMRGRIGRCGCGPGRGGAGGLGLGRRARTRARARAGPWPGRIPRRRWRGRHAGGRWWWWWRWWWSRR